ncbi:MAG: ATP phosphoribosyltransferase [Halobacteria archaeon]|nr:ATP phosphoribosyltransferase [Halobacteria archaeon]
MRIAVPNKGRLHDPTVELLEKAGLHVHNGAERRLYAKTVDPDITVLYARASDIPEYIAEGAADVGITGLDQAEEADVDVEALLDLGFGECRLVLAAPEEDEVESVEELEGKRVATEFPNIARNYFDEVGVNVDMVKVSGATELTPNAGMADAIIDITSTGTTLEVNHLEIVDEVLESSVHLFARPDVADDHKVQELETALRSVIEAEDKRYLMMNVPEDSLDDVKEVMPGLGGPTVMRVEGDDSMVAVHAVVEESEIYETINKVKQEGAQDVLVTPIERMMR